MGDKEDDPSLISVEDFEKRGIKIDPNWTSLEALLTVTSLASVKLEEEQKMKEKGGLNLMKKKSNGVLKLDKGKSPVDISENKALSRSGADHKRARLLKEKDQKNPLVPAKCKLQSDSMKRRIFDQEDDQERCFEHVNKTKKKKKMIKNDVLKVEMNLFAESKLVVEAYNTERALRKINRHPTSVALDGSANVKVKQEGSFGHKGVDDLPRDHVERPRLVSEEFTCQSNDGEGEAKSSERGGNSRRDGGSTNFVREPANWDPCSKGVDPDFLKASLASRGTLKPKKKRKDLIGEKKPSEVKPEEPPEDINLASLAVDASKTGLQKDGEKTLKDAVKPKHKRKKRASSTADASQTNFIRSHSMQGK